jgi:hypothetical protein
MDSAKVTPKTATRPSESVDEPEKNVQIKMAVNAIRNPVCSHGQRGSGTGMR